jgi:threonine/homoserine efflux transporter RhtA
MAGPVRRPHLSSLPAPFLVVGAVVSVQIGGALAKHVIDDVGPGAATSLRLVFAAVVLLALWRPRLRRSGLGLILLYGLTLVVMNLLFYEALARAPLGAVVTVEFLGPLGVAVAGSRRPRDIAVVALAGLGILLLARGGDHVSLLGLGLAALAGACWACYILVSAAVGREHPGASPLALAMAIAALVSIPFGAGRIGHADARSLVLGAAIGILSSVLPYSFELEALRRLPARAFGVMMSMEPAVAALAGLVILGEQLTGRQWAGVGCVIVACVAVTLGRRAALTPGVSVEFERPSPNPLLGTPELSGLDPDVDRERTL